MANGEKVARLGLRRVPGVLYFLQGGDVWSTPMKPPLSQQKLVAAGAFQREPGFLYFIDEDGDVARLPKAGGPPAMESPKLYLDLSAPPLQAVLRARRNDGNESTDPYFAVASHLEALGEPAARTRATFIRRQCDGDVAQALFEDQREAWGIPRFAEDLVVASDFRRGFLFKFRDHGTSWSHGELAREWFYKSPEAHFARQYEMWVDDPGEGEICEDRHSGTYRQILEAIVEVDVNALISPAFTDEEVLYWEPRIQREYDVRDAEHMIADLQRRRRGDR